MNSEQKDTTETQSTQRLHRKIPAPLLVQSRLTVWGYCGPALKLWRSGCGLRVTDESVPRPLRDLQFVRHIVRRAMVMSHRGRGCPREVIVQHASEPLVVIKLGIMQRLIETGDRALVHLLVQPVAAVSPHNRRLTTVLIGVCCWTTECLRPIRRKTLSVLGMVTVTERVANYFVLQHSCVPRVGQPHHSVETACSFIYCLHCF